MGSRKTSPLLTNVGSGDLEAVDGNSRKSSPHRQVFENSSMFPMLMRETCLEISHDALP
jgi:hypothetical protein